MPPSRDPRPTDPLPTRSPDARDRRPGPAQRAAAPRLRAEEAPERDPGLPLGRLVRVALPGAAPARARGRDRGRGPAGRADAPAGGFAATGSLKGDLAAARRAGRRAGQAVAPHPQGLPHHRAPATPASRSSSSPTTRTPTRRRPSRSSSPSAPSCLPPPASSCSSGGASRCSAGSTGPGARRGTRTDRYSRSLLEHRTRSTQRDLEWVEELIAAERSAEPGDESPTTPISDRPAPRPHQITDVAPNADANEFGTSRKEPPDEQVRSSRDRRRRQLREQPRAGSRVLPRRRPRRAGPRSHARRPRRLPRAATSSSSPRSTSTPTRSVSTSARRSSPARTTR